jgi:hypothetical protein
MGKINYGRVFLGGLLALLILIIAELVLEYLVLANIPGIGSEEQRFIEAFGEVGEDGLIHDVVNVLSAYLTCCLFIWVYAAVRPRFGPGPKTAIVVSAAFVIYWTLLLAWFSNVGLFPIKLSAVSFLTNLIELPLAVLAGAWIYREA